MLYLPAGLPAAEILRNEGFDIAGFPAGTIPSSSCLPTGTRRILFLNLMPVKIQTEQDIARMMAGRNTPVALLPVKIENQIYKNTPQEHIDRFYIDFSRYEADGKYDGLIVTGAPVEHLPFEEVRYWNRLCEIMDTAERIVRSTLYICWGAQAALYHFYGINKYGLPEKKFGIFPESPYSDAAQSHPLLHGLSIPFPIPHSRHTAIHRSDLSVPGLQCLAGGEESGPALAASENNQRVFITGHLEYDAPTLDREYRRDLAKNLPIRRPVHYYRHDNPDEGIAFSWYDTARTFYGNWLDLCSR